MIGPGGRCKIVGAVVALFVYIHMDVGQPVVVSGHALPGFQLSLPGPVAVQIEIVMIGPSTGPGLYMFPGFRTGIRHCVAYHPIPVGIPGLSIWIDTRVEYDQGIFEPGLGTWVPGIGECVQYRHCTFRACCFIAMDVEADPQDSRFERGINRSIQYPCAAEVVGPDGLEFGEVFRRGYESEQQWALFVGAAIFGKLYIRAIGCNVPDVAHDHFMWGKLLSKFMWEEFIR